MQTPPFRTEVLRTETGEMSMVYIHGIYMVYIQKQLVI